MKKRYFHAAGIKLLLLILAVLSYSCSERYLRTESAAPGQITGVYNLILYGGNSANDIKTVAILAREETPYTFDIFAPSFDYKIVKNVSAPEALEKAKKFVSFHPDFWKIQINEILAPQGSVIGYEVKPLYYPGTFSNPDIINTYYKVTGRKVIVFIRPRFRYPALDVPSEGSGGFGPR
jgi:subtilase family serine protease